MEKDVILWIKTIIYCYLLEKDGIFLAIFMSFLVGFILLMLIIGLIKIISNENQIERRNRK